MSAFDDYECEDISKISIWERWKYNRLNARRFSRVYCEDSCPGDDTCRNADICCCGSYYDQHGMWDGHSPVSMHYYYGKERTARDHLAARYRRVRDWIRDRLS